MRWLLPTWVSANRLVGYHVISIHLESLLNKNLFLGHITESVTLFWTLLDPFLVFSFLLSFGMTGIGTCDPKSFGSLCIRGTNESLTSVDSSFLWLPVIQAIGDQIYNPNGVFKSVPCIDRTALKRGSCTLPRKRTITCPLRWLIPLHSLCLQGSFDSSLLVRERKREKEPDGMMQHGD